MWGSEARGLGASKLQGVKITKWGVARGLGASKPQGQKIKKGVVIMSQKSHHDVMMYALQPCGGEPGYKKLAQV